MPGEETSVDFGIRFSSEKYGYDFPFINIANFLSHFDSIFGNLEALLTDINLNKKSLKSVIFRVSPYFSHILKKYGFDILSEANNHSLKFGKIG